jgi:hypothetical protein
LAGLGTHTVAAGICAAGRQFENWNPAYRQFSQERHDSDVIAGVVLEETLALQDRSQPVVVAMDDTHLLKSGKKTPGVGWKRDPMGPPFRVNLVRAQRFLQMSVVLPEREGPARLIPVDFAHAPTPPKPRKTAPPEEWKKYHQDKSESNVCLLAVRRLQWLRGLLEQKDGPDRKLLAVVDGGYTNKHLLRRLPPSTELIGRLRKDAKLFFLPAPEDKSRVGRKKSYGPDAPTPEELRADQTLPWETVPLFAAGKIHQFRIKTMGPLLWKKAGADVPLRLIVIAPLAYRPTKASRLLYRQPAFLITTDLEAPLQQVLQAYVNRWEIEVNFREEKQLIGVGEAQVRNPRSVETQPRFAVFAYALLLLAGRRAQIGPEQTLPWPKWRRPGTKRRATTQDYKNLLRAQLWGEGLAMDKFDGFVKEKHHDLKSMKSNPNLASAILYASA